MEARESAYTDEELEKLARRCARRILERSEERLARMERFDRELGFSFKAVVRRSDGAIIGNCGLKPITLAEGLLAEVVDVARKFAHRIDRSRVPCVSAWTKDIAQRVEHDPEGRRLRSVS